MQLSINCFLLNFKICLECSLVKQPLQVCKVASLVPACIMPNMYKNGTSNQLSGTAFTSSVQGSGFAPSLHYTKHVQNGTSN